MTITSGNKLTQYKDSSNIRLDDIIKVRENSKMFEIGREGLLDYSLMKKLETNELAKLNTMIKM